MRIITLAVVAALFVPVVHAQDRTPPRTPASEFWFDPTQLPSFTGTVERYLTNPRGQVDALLLREGAQVVFPPDIADVVRQAAPVGRPIVVWGIRARSAPVITMLAFAPNSDASPGVVDQFYWRLAGRTAANEAGTLTVAGVVKAPYYAPQGEVAGAVLEDGTVITLPPGVGAQHPDLLRPGARLVAEGRGVASEAGRAIAAERIGESADALRPVRPPAEPRQR
jgi:hypothetical protein